MNANESGGTTGYRGYEYQILVTVWLALKLMVQARVCKSIEVEPASQEDIEANLEVAPDSAIGLLGVVGKGTELDVQVKSRESGHWTVSEFAKILTGKASRSAKGTKRKNSAQSKRARPLVRLREVPTRRYLCVTNAQLHSELRPFSVANIGDRSTASELPFQKQPADSAALAPRIGVLAQQTHDHLSLQIGELLRHHGHVPPSRVNRCVDDLQDSVRHRLLREVSGTWTIEEVEGTLRAHEGLPSAPRELVPPAVYSEIQARLAAGRLILSGPPGTGKSFLSEHLTYAHRMADEQFEIVNSDAGIARIHEALNAPGQHLFVFDDPWGHYKLEPVADLWRSELPKLLQHATPAKRFLVTSRSGVMAQAFTSGEPAVLTEAEIRLTPEDYSPEARKRILAIEMKGAAGWQLDFARREENNIVSALGAPLSLQEFARRLRQKTRARDVDLEELIQQSNVEVISRTCAEEVRALGDEKVAAAVALWSVFMTHGAISEENVRDLGQELENGGYAATVDPLKLFRWLRKAGRLVATANGFSVHPTVMQGLELLIEDEPALARKVVSARLRSLARLDRGADLETLAKYIVTRSLPIPAAAQAALNEHLHNQVVTLDGASWRQAFRSVTQFSTGTDAATVLLKALQPTEQNGLPGFHRWQSPTLTAAQIDSIRKAPRLRAFAAKWVHHVLPEDSIIDCSATELSAFFNQFGWDLADEFFAVVIESLDDGKPIPMELYAEMALLTPAPRFDELLNHVLAAHDSALKWYESFKPELHKAEQAELDAAHASHIDEQPSDRFTPIESALATVVALRRRREGYNWLLAHPRRDDLIWTWAAAAERADAAELVAVRRACKTDDQRPFWKAVANAGRTELAVEVAKGLATAADDQIGACLDSLAKLVPAEDWQKFFSQIAPTLPLRRKLALMIAANSRHEIDDETRRRLGLTLFSQDEVSAVELCLQNSRSRGPGADSQTLPDVMRRFLEEIVRSGPEELAFEGLCLLKGPAALLAECLPRLLSSPSYKVRHNALLLASDIEGFNAGPALLHALSDEDYRCRRIAIRLLAKNANASEKRRILLMADDPSAPVREECAETIGKYSWSEGEQVLARLIHDTRDSSEGAGYRFGSPNYHVARVAAIALRSLGQLTPETARSIMDCIESYHPPDNRFVISDVGVPYELLLALAIQEHPGIPELYIRQLRSDWYVEGVHNSGYALRFAAAWGLVTHLSHSSDLRSQIDPAILFDGAAHSDDRLAGPCLMALGSLGDRAFGSIVKLVAAPEFTRERALILATTLPRNANAARTALTAALPTNSIEYRFLVWANEHRTASPRQGDKFLAQNPDIMAWLENIQTTEGILPELRWALNQRFAATFGAKFKYDDLFSRHLPKSIPVMTMRSMFGGE